MPTFDLRFPEEVRNVLAALAETLSQAGPTALLPKIGIPGDDDPDFADEWLAGLHTRIDADMAAVLALLNNPAFGTGPVELGDDEALAILRGFTTLRLTLRETALRTIDDESLETGRIDRRKLGAPRRHALACYAVFGEIQGACCHILDE